MFLVVVLTDLSSQTSYFIHYGKKIVRLGLSKNGIINKTKNNYDNDIQTSET